MDELFYYDVPEDSASGSCAFKKKSSTPFDLRPIYGLSDQIVKQEDLKEHELTEKYATRLTFLKQVVTMLQSSAKPDWVGIYRKVNLNG